jgi:hypothetical protein
VIIGKYFVILTKYYLISRSATVIWLKAPEIISNTLFIKIKMNCRMRRDPAGKNYFICETNNIERGRDDFAGVKP